MRNKIVLVKGQGNIAPRITLAQFERVNADAVVFITALKYPQFMPEIEFQIDLMSLQHRIHEIMDFWKHIDQCHMLFAEYANLVIDIGLDNIKCVEGISLKTKWFYDCVKTYHRNFDQIVVECELFEEYAQIDKEQVMIEEIIQRFGSNQSLG